ncbi:MAG: DUF1653 domain-containing protein [Solibacillus sp.]
MQYKHYKGNIYTIITIGKHTETNEELVVYTDEKEVWVRPAEMFFGVIIMDGIEIQRFEKID